MALKDKWTDKVDGVDDILAEDINAIAREVIDIEKQITNINFTETDPTVPEWAKQPQKPAYTAEEVGALPDDTEIPSLEGLATQMYVDNAVADKITIPKSAEIGQTIAVKEIDENGKPTMWEAVDLPNNSGGDIQSGNDWKLLADVALTEDVSRVSIYEDINGNKINTQGFEELYISYSLKGKEGYSSRYSTLVVWFSEGFVGNYACRFESSANGYDVINRSIYAVVPKKQHYTVSPEIYKGIAFIDNASAKDFVHTDAVGMAVGMESQAGFVAGSRIVVYGR